ncbi:MAG: hypothetical protein GXP19_03695 [Gammaproteobacteria bacterium]|nr:hypothetical protein [Gammaproteobacteria bacterium]
MFNKIFFYSIKSRQFYFATKLLFITVLLPVVVACGSSSKPAGNTPTDSPVAVKACVRDSDNKTFVDTNLASANIIEGGLAYDKWWVGTRGTTEPLDDHPLWDTQTTNTRTGADTWRCKECHGWDYLGKDGAYSPANSHFTGFVGIMEAKAKDAIEVFCTIKSLENHAFGDVMTDDDILDLTAFIIDFGDQSEGLIDYRVVLDSNNISTGDGSVGGTGNQDYDSSSAGGCGAATCHDIDGTKNAGGEFSIGDIALDNPWEFLHKVRYGHPGSIMPSGINRNLELPQMADILAYAQAQLPEQNQNAINACINTNASFVDANLSGADIIDGGLAYDKWWVTTRGTEPLDNHPLWSTQTTNTRTGADTWRCKECHGWDYQGKDGAYGPANSHFTGFVGIMEAKAKDAIEVFCTIKSLENHAFGDVMTDNNILDLTAFIVDFGGQSEGIIDYRVVLDSDNISTGDGSVGGAGNRDYDLSDAGGCGAATCHDIDGTKNAGSEFSIGNIALDNPWEFLHKVRYGHPGSIMPSGIKRNLELLQMADILAYAQAQLPQQNQDAVTACINANASVIDTNLSGADIVAGGLAYDKWWVGTSGTTEPLDDHPLWDTQTTNTRTGADTWRCKECHGWDYLGKDGAYGPANSHFTGFAGVMEAKVKDPTTVFCTIKSLENHAFGDVLPEKSILELTAFIVDYGGQSKGIIDYNVVLDSDNISTGDGAVNGAGNRDYNLGSAGGCSSSSCHDIDGTQNAGNEFSIGDVAFDNPWEFLHKVRYGHPGSTMPSGIERNLEFLQMADILAYAQLQLPRQGPGGGIEGDYIRGGLLYDNWPAVLTAEGSTATQPTTTMPLFELRSDPVVNTRAGLETWRCKECHGWDYKGADGAYGDSTNSHFTGFTGVLDARDDNGVTESFLLNFLKNGYTTVGNVTYHKFTPYMTEADLIQLVSFIKTGVIDTARYISTTPVGAGKGNPVNGELLYIFNEVDVNSTAGCSRCHALDGTGIDFDSDPIATEFLKDIAIGNPWEVLHKIRFGEPHSIGLVDLEMPSALRDGFTNSDAADILTYSQQLP